MANGDWNGSDALAGFYEPWNTTVNVEDSISSLFREIGTTLQDVARQGISTAGATVKTLLADKIMKSPEGQAQVASYKAEYLFRYLPWIALLAVALFFGGKYFSRS